MIQKSLARPWNMLVNTMSLAEHHVSCGEYVAIRHKQLLFWGKLDLWVSCTLGCHRMTLSRVVRGRHFHFKLTLSEYTQTTYENNSLAKALSSNVCVVFSCKMVGNSHLEPEISRIKQCVAGLISGVWTKRLLLYTHEPNQTFSPNIYPIKGGGGRGGVGSLALPRQVRVYFFLSVAGSCSHVPFFSFTSSCPRSPLWLTITFHMWSPALAANAEVCPNVARRCSFDGSFAVDVVLTQVF